MAKTISVAGRSRASNQEWQQKTVQCKFSAASLGSTYPGRNLTQRASEPRTLRAPRTRHSPGWETERRKKDLCTPDPGIRGTGIDAPLVTAASPSLLKHRFIIWRFPSHVKMVKAVIFKLIFHSVTTYPCPQRFWGNYSIIPQDIIPINMVIFPLDISPISGWNTLKRR